MKSFRRRKFEAEMDAELRFHMEAFVEDQVRSGVDRDEAERRARVEFGSLELKKDECRQAWGLQWLDELRADLRLTCRTLRRNPGFAIVAMLSLALGIGANTAIFGLADAVMFRSLPVREPERLVLVQVVGSEGPNGGPPYPWFELFRDKTTSFEGVAAFSPSNMELTIDNGREQARGIWVSSNFYRMLGVRPLIGGDLAASGDGPAASRRENEAFAVISSAYWRQRFGGDPDVVGRRLRLFDHTVTIVGVMPAEAMTLEPGRPIDIAVPITLSNPATLRDRGSWWLEVAGRLKPGVAVEQARAEADVLFQAYMADLSTQNSAYARGSQLRKLVFDRIELAGAARGSDQLRRQFSNPLLALMILSGIVLLAACVNVANLMLARATAREREFAVRIAIGAGRGRLIRQTLTEAIVLVGIGSAFGVVLAVRGEMALASFFAEGNSQIVLDLALNARMLLFTFAVSLLTGLAFGLLPALRAARVDPAAGFQSGSRSVTGGRTGMRVGRALIVLQVALSTVLLSGAGLFTRSLRQLESVDLGFTRQGILTMEVAPERQMNGTPEWQQLQAEILRRIGSLPGVRSASWSTMSPLSGRDRGVALYVPGFTPKGLRDNAIHLMSVSPEHFQTYGIAVMLGRAFTERDGQGAPKVAILSESAARFYFGAESPVGKRVGFVPKTGEPDYRIVGVVKDVKHESIRKEPWRFIYLPIPQSIDRINRLALAVRGPGDAAFGRAVQREVRESGSSLLITNISTVEKQVKLSLMRERLVSALSMAFGILALVLACIGLYGIVAYSAARRTQEIGIRMALGATRTGMVWLVLREALFLTCAGIAVGVPASLVFGRLTEGFLYGVKPFDIPVLAATALLLLFFTALAGLVPARSASRLNPMLGQRSE